jgi:hypothetical protein
MVQEKAQQVKAGSICCGSEEETGNEKRET